MDAFNNVQLHMTKSCRSKLHDRNQLWKKAHEVSGGLCRDDLLSFQEYKMPMPDSLSGLFSLISDHPQRSSIISWLAVFVCVLFCIGCCCGRVTKRVHRELKNR
jgi:Golgi apparatus protein 1